MKKQQAKLNMRFFILTMLTLMAFNMVKAQSPPVNWAFSVDAQTPEAEIWGTCADKDGNYFVTGRIQDTTTFGSVVLNTVGAGSNFYLVKYDETGNVVWGRTFNTSNSSAIGYGVCADLNGDVIVSGTYRSATITIGTTTLTNLSNGSLPDIFLVKYDTNGNIIWVKGEGGDKTDGQSKVSTDSTGNIYLAFQGSSESITIGSQTLITKNLQFSSLSDIYVVKYDANGNALWARNDGSTQDDKMRGFSVDSSGNSYVTGNINGATSYSFAPFNLSSISTNDFYIVKYNTSGNVEWVHNAGNATGYDVNVDNNGTVAITGDFGGTSLTINGFTIAKSNPNGQLFTAILNQAGNVSWIKTEDGIGGSQGASVRIDKSGNILVGAMFYGTSITIDTSTFTCAGSNDIILFKYDAGGSVQWSEAIQSSGFDRINDIAINADGDELISGLFLGAILTFSDSTLTNTLATGTYDLFFINYLGEKGIVWTGNSSDSWFDVNNWEPQQIPVDTNNVVIPAGRPNYPILKSFSNASCKNLKISDGASFRMNAGIMNVYGEIKAPNSNVFNLIGGGLHLYHGSNFPPLMEFNNLTITNINDVEADNIYKFPGAAQVIGKFKVFGTNTNQNLPKIILEDDDLLVLFGDFVMTKGKIGLENSLITPVDKNKIPAIRFDGPLVQNVTIKNASDNLGYYGDVYCNILINNENVIFKEPNRQLILMNLIVNKTFDLKGKEMTMTGKIIYTDSSSTNIKIINSIPSKGKIMTFNDPATVIADNNFQYIKIDRLSRLICNFYNNIGSTVLVTPLKVDTLMVTGYLDLNGQNLTMGSTSNGNGYLQVDSLGTAIPQGTLFLYSNGSDPYNLVAKELNNLVLNHPIGVILRNALDIPTTSPSWAQMKLYGTAKLINGYFDLEGTEVYLSKDAAGNINKGKIIEAPFSPFDDFSALQVGSLNIDTTITTAITNKDYGGLGFIISCANPLNDLTIRRLSKSQFGTNGGNSIDRVYHITNPLNNSLNVFIKIKYDDSELFSVNESDLRIFRRSDSEPAGVWNLVPSTVNTATNTVTASVSLSQLDYAAPGGQTEYTLASASNPLRETEIANQSASNTTKVVVCPNPFTTNLTAQFASEISEQATMQVVDFTGKLIEERSVQLNKGGNIINLCCMDELPAGIYFLKITSSQTNSIVKVVKQ